jgi:hypothetical protein
LALTPGLLAIEQLFAWRFLLLFVPAIRLEEVIKFERPLDAMCEPLINEPFSVLPILWWVLG